MQDLLSLSSVPSESVQSNLANRPVNSVTTKLNQGADDLTDASFNDVYKDLTGSEDLKGLLTQLKEELQKVLNGDGSNGQNSDPLQQLNLLLDGQDLSHSFSLDGEGLPPVMSELRGQLDDLLAAINTGAYAVQEGGHVASFNALKSTIFDLKLSLDTYQSSGNLNLISQQAYPLEKLNVNGAAANPVNVVNYSPVGVGVNPELAASAMGALQMQGPMNDPSMQNTLDMNLNAKLDLASQLVSDMTDASDSDGGGEYSSRQSYAEIQAKAAGASLKQYSTVVTTGVNDQEWPDEMGQKIVWLTGRNIQSAEIHLNPAEFGPIDVKISVQNDAASVTINAQNSSVRELLESNVHKLRDMIESNGVDVLDVNVGSGEEDPRYAGQEQENGGQGSGSAEDGLSDSSEDSLVQSAVSSVSSNLVDYFA